MDILKDLPGLSGLFIAGVFSAALSSLSTCLNSMSAVVLEDFFKPFTKKPLSTRAVDWIMRTVVVGVGVLCVALVYVVEKMGTVLQLTMSLEAITNGPLLGIFSIGILLPWINGNVGEIQYGFAKRNRQQQTDADIISVSGRFVWRRGRSFRHVLDQFACAVGNRIGLVEIRT